MIYVVYLALALITFLVVLNGFFTSAKKAHIDAVLCLLLIGLINISFFIAGWKFGLIAIAIVFITSIITSPIAARLTSRLVALSSDSRGVYVGLPSRRLQQISHELGKSFDTNNVMEEDIFSDGDRKTSAEKALLDYCEQQPTIQVLLREHNISRQDLQSLYHQLLMAGAGQWICGHWVAASALAYPESLRYMLTRKGENMQKTAFNLIMYFEKGTALET